MRIDLLFLLLRLICFFLLGTLLHVRIRIPDSALGQLLVCAAVIFGGVLIPVTVFMAPVIPCIRTFRVFGDGRVGRGYRVRRLLHRRISHNRRLLRIRICRTRVWVYRIRWSRSYRRIHRRGVFGDGRVGRGYRVRRLLHRRISHNRRLLRIRILRCYHLIVGLFGRLDTQLLILDVVAIGNGRHRVLTCR